MGLRIKSTLTVALSVPALAMTLFAAPALADGPVTRQPGEPVCTNGSACFYETPWEGKTSWYANPGSECVTLPFPAFGIFNLTDKRLDMYATADCTGDALSEPANDFHTWQSWQPRMSFRAV
ncbi:MULTISPECIES: hypothetical protein [Streptomyces]|uniref:hypothetical protein n=1 Tax=Streptomyces TaxID=1883 RepID=UPI00069C9862|nr:hypothetical protein [Streptomyces sp. SID7805]MYU51795.1 hypothetical protein [Streptomyces sp. SID7805]